MLNHASASEQDSAVTLKTPNGEIHGSLVLPKGAANGEIPVVLIIAGSGPTDRNGNQPTRTNNALQMLAHALAEHGIASVRYDKRAVAQSAAVNIEEKDLRFDHYIDDAKRRVQQLRADKRFAGIIILGHSEGALIGMIAAREGSVAAYISLAGIGRPADIVLREQLEK